MVASKCGRWCHMACVLWTPEAFMAEDDTGIKADVTHVSKVWRLPVIQCQWDLPHV